MQSSMWLPCPRTFCDRRPLRPQHMDGTWRLQLLMIPSSLVKMHHGATQNILGIYNLLCLLPKKKRRGRGRGRERLQNVSLGCHYYHKIIITTKYITFIKHCHIIQKQKYDSPPFTVSKGERVDLVFLWMFSPLQRKLHFSSS